MCRVGGWDPTGTRLTIRWPPKLLDDLLRYASNGFRQLIESYVWFNPHLI
jgi:hypothetical protein